MDDNTLINTNPQEEIISNLIKDLSIEISELLENSADNLYKLQRKQSLYNQLLLIFQKKGKKIEKTILDISKNVFIADKIKNTKGIKSTIARLGKPSILNFSVVDKAGYDFLLSQQTEKSSIIKKLVQDNLGVAYQKYTESLEAIRTQAGREVASEIIDEISKSKLQGLTIDRTNRKVRELLESGRITGIKYINKKGIESTVNGGLNAVAKGIVRQSIVQSSTASTLTACFENNFDLVYVPKHSNESKMCKGLSDQVYSISGKNKKYKKFSSVIFDGDYNAKSGFYHRYCRHKVIPYTEAEEIDFDYS